MAVYMDLAQGDTLVIGGSRVRIERKSGQRVRLMIDSQEDIERIKAGDDVPAMKQPATAPAPPAPASNKPFLQRPVPAAN